MFNRYFIFLVCFMGMLFSASMVDFRKRISKKKRILAPSINVSKFQLDISILSIVFSRNKILEHSGKKVSNPPHPLININRFALFFYSRSWYLSYLDDTNPSFIDSNDCTLCFKNTEGRGVKISHLCRDEYFTFLPPP